MLVCRDSPSCFSPTYTLFIGFVGSTSSVHNCDCVLFLRVVLRLVLRGGDDEKVVASSRGRCIVFESECDGDMEIFVMAADGSNQTQLTFNDDYDDRYPAWCPME